MIVDKAYWKFPNNFLSSTGMHVYLECPKMYFINEWGIQDKILNIVYAKITLEALFMVQLP